MCALLIWQISQFINNDDNSFIQQYFWIPLIILIILVIVIIYRLLFPSLPRVSVDNNQEIENLVKEELEDTTEEATNEPIKQVGLGPQEVASREVALRFLEGDERKVVEVLLEANGSILQKDISRMTGFSRVKTHRVLVRLIRRGVVTAEKYYNTNKIILSDAILDKKNK